MSSLNSLLTLVLIIFGLLGSIFAALMKHYQMLGMILCILVIYYLFTQFFQNYLIVSNKYE